MSQSDLPTIHDLLIRAGYKPTSGKSVSVTLSEKQVSTMQQRGGRKLLLRLLRRVLALNCSSSSPRPN